MKKLPTIRYVPTGKVHYALGASGGPEDGSLHGFYTYCSRLIDLEKAPDVWVEEPEAEATCGTCIKGEHAGRNYRELSELRAANAELLYVCEMALADYEAAYLVLFNDRGDTAQRRADLDERIRVLRVVIEKAR